MNTKLFEEFLVVAEVLNTKFDIEPLLYGSLGLEIVTGHNFNPEDIDLLIPHEFVADRWDEFKTEIEKHGYQLKDLHEHEFAKDNMRIAFARNSDLIEFAGVDIDNVEVRKHSNIRYKILNLQEYYRVYQRSSYDGYRNTKKNNKDAKKIEIIKGLLEDNQ